MTGEHSERKSETVRDFHGRQLPEPGRLAGYGAFVDKYQLKVPLPTRLTAISERHVRELAAFSVCTFLPGQSLSADAGHSSRSGGTGIRGCFARPPHG